MLVDETKTQIGAISPLQINDSDYSKTGYHLEVILDPEQVTSLAEVLIARGFYIEDVTAIDLNPDMEVIYHYAHTDGACRVTGRTYTPRTAPEVPSISGIYSGANWHERETHDFFGIKFTGHPYLVPLLLPEDAEFHPLVKADAELKQAKDVRRVEGKEAAAPAAKAPVATQTKPADQG
ncbi:MAG: NADH-quinone oxidoreductase subunit C [Pseudomonadota bacterium]